MQLSTGDIICFAPALFGQALQIMCECLMLIASRVCETKKKQASISKAISADENSSAPWVKLTLEEKTGNHTSPFCVGSHSF